MMQSPLETHWARADAGTRRKQAKARRCRRATSRVGRLRFEVAENAPGTGQQGRAESRELSDVDAVALVRRPFRHLVQEDDVVPYLAHAHMEIDEPGQLGGEPRELVVVRGEQGAR